MAHRACRNRLCTSSRDRFPRAASESPHESPETPRASKGRASARVSGDQAIRGKTATRRKGTPATHRFPSPTTIEADRVSFRWRGPNNTRFGVNVSMYEPEYGNRSIEGETNSFYRDHKGDEDLRFLEIDGVRGRAFSTRLGLV